MAETERDVAEQDATKRDAEKDEGRFQFNTVAMASLAVIFVVFSVTLLSDTLYQQDLDEFGYPVVVVDAAPVEEDSGPAYDPVLPLLASADPAAGEGIFRRCSSCHAVTDENKTGPGLNGIVGRAVAAHPGYGYSSALVGHADEAPAWTYEELNGFLWKPKTWVPGTSMGFAGLEEVQDRANVIAYLRQISGDPPLPTEEEIAAVLATDEETIPEDAAVNAAADGAPTGGSVGVSADVRTGQGVPGNETAPESIVDPDDLRDTAPGDPDPAAAVLPDGTIIDDAAADDLAADGVPVAPLPDGEISEEEIEAASDEPIAVEDATPVVPVTPSVGAPEVEGAIVDPTPDPVVVIEEVPAVDGAVVGDDAVAPVAPAAPAVTAPVEGGARSYTVPIE